MTEKRYLIMHLVWDPYATSEGEYVWRVFADMLIEEEVAAVKLTVIENCMRDAGQTYAIAEVRTP